MNAFGLALIWVSLQVSVLCLVAMAVYLIARRGSPNAGAAATLSGLLLVVLLSAVALSPWPRWSYGEATSPADAAVVDASASSNLATESDDQSAEISVANLQTAGGKEESLSWYSPETMRQFWIALQEAPATAEAVEEASSLNWSGGWPYCFWPVRLSQFFGWCWGW